MSRQEDFNKASDDYVEGEPDGAQKIVGQVGFEFGAEYGYKYAVEKACEWLRAHIGVDMPVRLNPDGEPLAEDFFNKAEARCKAADKVVEQFKRAMEE